MVAEFRVMLKTAMSYTVRLKTSAAPIGRVAGWKDPNLVVGNMTRTCVIEGGVMDQRRRS